MKIFIISLAMITSLVYKPEKNWANEMDQAAANQYTNLYIPSLVKHAMNSPQFV